jgi:hypothetical protein
MIKFLQHSSHRYPPRTFENASADATIAFAFDFNTPGEVLTKEAVKTQSKLYIPVKPKDTGNELKIKIVSELLSSNRVVSLNIAGNQLATCSKYEHTQDMVDLLVLKFLRSVFTHPVFDSQYLKLIRSGGQSGFDEAGLKAAVELGLSALCVCPKGWKFADETGRTICDEQLFKNRFPREFIM